MKFFSFQSWSNQISLIIFIIIYLLPLLFNFQTGKAASTVDRLTDVSKYTGSHKQRFDESGKGKGIAGRKDIPDQSGYVQGYQNKDTYKAH